MEQVWGWDEEEQRRLHEQRFTSQAPVWTDTPERVRFWRRQDPLFLTAFNERRMAHYGRVAYANLRFSLPSKGIAGWRTDMGKAYIKFGRYLHRSVSLPNTLPKETWVYETFRLSFISNTWLGKWRFGLGSGVPAPSLRTERVVEGRNMYTITSYGNGLADFYGGKNRASLRSAPVPSSGYVFRRTPQRYVDPYLRQKYSLPLPEGREDLVIVPEPLRTYARTAPVFIYLEVYNLKRNRFGRTRYEIS